MAKKKATRKKPETKTKASPRPAAEPVPYPELTGKVASGQKAQVVDVFSRLLHRSGRYQFTALVTAVIAWGGGHGTAQVSETWPFVLSEEDALGAPERVIEQYIQAQDKAREKLADKLQACGVRFGALRVQPDAG